MKRLLLLRHGKSDWEADYGRDHDRPLAERGRAAAALMGRFVRAAGLIPDLAVTSTAVRARTTLEIAVEAGGWECDMWEEPDLYGTGPETVLRVVEGFDDGYQSAMIVGHQPTWGQLVHHLTGAVATVPTACLVGIDLDATTWRRTGPHGGTLRFVIPPRLLGDLNFG
jgi:phosphohistidine phosphatase